MVGTRYGQWLEVAHTTHGVSPIEIWLTDSWVRSWILFRLAVIAQGIAARAALGQASSADAREDSREVFDFFGRMAWEAKLDDERAKL
jgi:hypothetical protein